MYVTIATAYGWASERGWLASFSVHHSPRPSKRVVSRVLAVFLLQCVADLIVSAFSTWHSHDCDVHDPSILRLTLSALVLDTYQYWTHRAMHTFPTLYKNVHKTHHELGTPIARGALYNSFSECIFVDVASFALAQLCVGLTPLETCILGSAATLKTISDHSGVVFVGWFGNDASYHYRHHAKGHGNFQQPFFTFWDDLMGTRI